MIRILLQRLEDGRIVITLKIGHHTLLHAATYVTDSEPVTLEVPDE